MKSLQRSITMPIISFKPSDYNIKNDEDKFVFVGKIYGILDINKDITKVSEFLENFTVFNKDELLNASDGIYNWLLYSDTSEDIKFISTQIVSPYDIGTTHQSIACNNKVDAVVIYGAGELKKEGNKIIFNLVSGTFTKKLIQFDFDKIVKNQIINKFNEIFPDSEYDNTTDSYIYNLKTVSNKLLELYKHAGYFVKTFELSNDCNEFHNKFWSIDWNMEYYKKKLDIESEDNYIIRKLYMETLEAMINLLKTD